MTLVIGHRGAPRVAPENTVASFRAARELGADMVELDVRRTADGALAVLHDAVLPDGRALIELARAELPAWVPTLDAALDACEGMAVNIEVKNAPHDPDYDETDALAAAVVAEIDRRDERDRMLVSSFNLRVIDRVRVEDPGIATAWLVVDASDPQRLLDRLIRHEHGVLHPFDRAVSVELVTAAASAGIALNVWTVNDPDRMLELAALGVAGIVTDLPDLAVATLRDPRVTPEASG